MLYAAIRSMGRKKEKTINLTELEPKEKLKYEIAEELGLLDRVMQDGWKSLTSKETGRIGGMVTGRRREIKKQTKIADKNDERSLHIRRPHKRHNRCSPGNNSRRSP